VLVVRYEDLARDLPSAARHIAAFCAIDVNERRLAEVVARSSFQFMKGYEQKLDPMEAIGLAPQPDGAPFLRRGQVGESRGLVTDEMCARYSAMATRWIRSAQLEDYRFRSGETDLWGFDWAATEPVRSAGLTPER
jgi:hypothetical protein